MKTCLASRVGLACLTLIAGIGLATAAELFPLVSARDPSQDAPAGAGGDSYAPIMSPDGRYVLFVSTAGNLVLTTNNMAMAALSPAKLNAFLRDRVQGTTELVSVNLTGVRGGNGDSFPVALSTNGLAALFESTASDLVPGDTNNSSDVFLRDLAAGTTRLVSANTNGTVGNGASGSAVMTPDGRYVAFSSAASNLVPGDTNGIADVFVRDMQAETTTLVSAGAMSAGSVLGRTSSSEGPQITPDGRYVAFSSTATNLVPGVSLAGDIYVRDLILGATYWASSDARTALQAAQASGNAVCYGQVISADGQFVAYQANQSSTSTGLRPGIVLRYGLASGATDFISTNAAVPTTTYENLQDVDITADGQLIAFLAQTNGLATTCVYVWNADQNAVTLVSGNLTNGVPAPSTCHSPTLDPQGRWVAFVSSAANTVTNPLTGLYHLYLRDLQTATTTLLDADSQDVGLPLSLPASPCLTPDARFVAFACADTGLVANDRNHDSDLFVRDCQTGASELISMRVDTLPSLAPNGASLLSACSVSANGDLVAFASDADNLVPNDTNRCRDIFVRDLVAGTNLLVSVNTNGAAANQASTDPAISGNGRYVAFAGNADDLVAGDTNNAMDVFVRDLVAGTTVLVSLNVTGTGPGNNDSYGPILSADARFVAFRSKAGNLTSASFSGENLCVRDLQAGTNYLLTANNSPNGILGAAMTPDGRFIFSSSSGSSASWRVWDSLLTRGVFTNVVTELANGLAISPDGNRVAYTTSAGVFARDLTLNTTYTISASAVHLTRPALRFSQDSRWLAYTELSNTLGTNINQVDLYDFQYGTNLLVSRRFDSAGGASGFSDFPDLSADGRFVAYQSDAANLVPGDTNSQSDIFLYDRSSGATTLLSASRFGTSAAGRSTLPVFSGDGQTLVFQSWASDLAAQDFNHAEDIVAYSLYASGEIPVFCAQVIPAATFAQQPLITWPAVPGKTYRLQFKADLRQPDWQDLTGGITFLGTQGYGLDAAPAPAQRFYRIVAD